MVIGDEKIKRQPSILNAVIPVASLLIIIIYGFIVRPFVLEQTSIPLEIIFIIGASVAICHLLILGYSWKEILDNIISKEAQALPAIFILFSIGLLIGSWMVSGTIPMLVYYGIKIINPDYIYIIGFTIPIIFSTLTGTSWGSAGTIGVVIMGIGATVEANLPLLAGAVIGGSYFGDKISPLSDTTVLSALGADVELYDHIRSMMYTTLPAALIAAVIYYVKGGVLENGGANILLVKDTLAAFESSFNFNIFLLLPPVIILCGALKRLPGLPVMLLSVFCAVVLAFLNQDFSSTDIFLALTKGFNANMIDLEGGMPTNVAAILDRGGIYSLSEAVTVTILVFVYFGALSTMNAIPVIVDKIFWFVKTREQAVVCTLISTSITSAMTTSQYATAFIVGDAFRQKYKTLGLSRRVLSRSLEDAGTIIESLVPWTPTTLFMVATLGVAYSDYVSSNIFPIINIAIAYVFALRGIAFFKEENKQELGN